ncbi:sulfatase-like hydrolase/transferase [Rheinheimera metallidurans]|uniref:sulfatase-like hydrolase/transferase n=1 Tax=Rheinheimera metallidurans TaxID=2925781 RepID=UPI0030034115
MQNLIQHYLKPFFYLLILPNFFLFSVAIYLGIGRSPVNLDYLFASLFVYSRVPIIGYIVFLVFFLLDILALLVQVFTFAKLDHLVYLSSFLPNAPAAYQMATLASMLWLVLFMVNAVKLKKHTSLTQALVLFNLALGAFGLYVYSADSDNTDKVWRVQHAPLVSSPTLHTLKHRSTLFYQYFYDDGEIFDKFIPPSATQVNNARFYQSGSEKLLLIINESWGVAKDEHINAQLIRPIIQLDHYVKNLHSGQINFLGATVAGELRELCQLSPNHFNLKDAANGFENCIPNKLKRQGYATTAFHAASGVMYDRIYWYAKAGFDNSRFFENLNWTRRCYSYPGGCDLELINKVIADVAQPGKRFTYWLTLNSHAIYDERDIVIDQFDCAQFSVDVRSQTCRNLKLQAQFFYILAKKIAEEKLVGVKVLIVSDHAPVITNKTEMEQYFIENKVNWLSFEILTKLDSY